MNKEVTFDSLLRMAIRETYIEEITAIPEENKLEEILHPSDEYKRKTTAILHKQSNNEKLHKLGKIVSKVAVVILICISLSFSTLLTAQAVRESVVTTILEWHDKFTKIFIKSDVTLQELPEIRFNYIPEGFELVEEKTIIKSSFKIFNYESINNHYISIYFNFDNLNIDNEHSDYYLISVDDVTGKWINSTSENQLIIPKNNIAFSIKSSLSLAELIKIYENIQIL